MQRQATTQGASQRICHLFKFQDPKSKVQCRAPRHDSSQKFTTWTSLSPAFYNATSLHIANARQKCVWQKVPKGRENTHTHIHTQALLPSPGRQNISSERFHVTCGPGPAACWCFCSVGRGGQLQGRIPVILWPPKLVQTDFNFRMFVKGGARKRFPS